MPITSQSLQQFHELLKKHPNVQVAGVNSSLTHYLVQQCTRQDWMNIWIILPKIRDLTSWHTFFEDNTFNRELLTFSHSNLWTYNQYQNIKSIRNKRIQTLFHLQKENPSIILTTWTSMWKTTLRSNVFSSQLLSLSAGHEYDYLQLTRNLKALGYIETKAVHNPGQFLFRGGNLEIFPPHLNNPVRLEFFADEVAKIHSFNVENRQNIKIHQNLDITPVFEKETTLYEDGFQRIYDMFIQQEVPRAVRDGVMHNLHSKIPFQGYEQFLPYLTRQPTSVLDFAQHQSNLWIFPFPKDSYEKAHQDTLDLYQSHFEQEKQNNQPVGEVSQHFQEPISLPGTELHLSSGIPNPQSQLITWNKPFESPSLLEKDLESFWQNLEWVQARSGQVVLTGDEDQLHKVQILLNGRNFQTAYSQDVFFKPEQDRVLLVQTSLEEKLDLWFEVEKTWIVPLLKVFGPTVSRKKHQQKLSDYLSSLKELHLNDIIVHPSHGLGKYLGTHHFKTADGTSGDYIELSYEGNVKVYVPVEDINILTRYGIEGSAKVDKIGGSGWKNRKSKAKKAIQDLASELLKVHAQRSTATPFFLGSGSSDSYHQFEEEFPWQETEDQLRSIDEINQDLCSGKVMDRLLVGDVGFGKTEVAMRSAYKMVLAGYQVIVLVPTTILCQQHANSFHQRLNHHGVEVRRLDRSIKKAQMEEIQLEMESGQCDILVSTHRILSTKWNYSNLGLIIVDEEQRFGVSHKEKLKSIRSNVHVLSMTATPIPRTLHMSMIGLRDISLIETPPKNRRPVKTEVVPISDQAIQEAIYRELDRDGQVFVIYNRVQDIERMKQKLGQLIPEAGITVAHGQMPEKSLERSIQEFLSHKTSILLCTTIVESGIDMPQVNTLVVYNAERFGLSQLHQIRGRVGRSELQAYALFLTQPPLSDDAHARLDSLIHHQELNAGYAIASQDLDLRGAGDLLGSQQSGHIGAIGLNLYTSMLEHAIAELQGHEQQEKIQTEILLGTKPAIPRDYINTDIDRLKTYRMIFESHKASQQTSLRDRILQNYGKIPHDVEQLFTLSRIKHQLSELGVIRAKKVHFEEVLLTFEPGYLQKALQNANPSKLYELNPNGEIRIPLPDGTKTLEAVESALMELTGLQD